MQSRTQRDYQPSANQSYPTHETQNTKLYVTNFVRDLTNANFNALFGEYGKLTEISIYSSNRVIIPYAFIQFDDLRDAVAAKNALNHKLINGLYLRVQYKRVRTLTKSYSSTSKDETPGGQMPRENLIVAQLKTVASMKMTQSQISEPNIVKDGGQTHNNSTVTSQSGLNTKPDGNQMVDSTTSQINKTKPKVNNLNISTNASQEQTKIKPNEIKQWIKLSQNSIVNNSSNVQTSQPKVTPIQTPQKMMEQKNEASITTPNNKQISKNNLKQQLSDNNIEIVLNKTTSAMSAAKKKNKDDYHQRQKERRRSSSSSSSYSSSSSDSSYSQSISSRRKSHKNRPSYKKPRSNKSRSRSRSKRRQRDRRKQRSRPRDSNKERKTRQYKRSSDRSQSRERRHSKSRQRERDKQKQRLRQREKQKQRQRERERERQRQRQRQREKQKQKQKDRQRQRQKQNQKEKQKEKQKQKQKQKLFSSRLNDREKQKQKEKDNSEDRERDKYVERNRTREVAYYDKNIHQSIKKYSDYDLPPIYSKNSPNFMDDYPKMYAGSYNSRDGMDNWQPRSSQSLTLPQQPNVWELQSQISRLYGIVERLSIQVNEMHGYYEAATRATHKEQVLGKYGDYGPKGN